MFGGSDEKPLNEWISIWLHPRNTVNFLMESKSTKFIWIVTMIAGFFNTLGSLSFDPMNDTERFSETLRWSFIIGTIGGLFCLYAVGGFFHLFAMLFGGKGKLRGTFMAYCVPNLFFIILGAKWLLDWFLISRGLDVSAATFSTFQESLFIITNKLAIILLLCSSVAFIISIAEVHAISIWKAISTFLIPAIIIYYFILPLLYLMLYYIWRSCVA
ncbi:YIP1 family protein [Sporosarcina saromensis]|uniref:YIP1 family protein n=1 Tax=Sporosarcina saromensis TaxID=359365 RepID=A0ABU4GA77_9BACL|nr:YIP1 family protein [Sporosarcina saromensis]MDW0113870.1 YIP1 family protein [Sporosarcina saromensis]